MSVSGGIRDLIDFWSDFECTAGDQRVHRCDQQAMEGRRAQMRNIPLVPEKDHSKELTKLPPLVQLPSLAKKGFHLSLTPVPYVGDLESADIFLLMINPGVGYPDYATDACLSFQELLLMNRSSDFHGKAQPCHALDPQYGWTSWFSYYAKELGATVLALADAQGESYLSSLQILASRLAILELVPYYSANAEQIGVRFLNSLKSVTVARNAAKELVSKAEAGTATVMVRWTHDRFGLGDHKHVLHLPGRPSLSTTVITPILKRLGVPRGAHLKG